MYITGMRRISDTVVIDFSQTADLGKADYELYVYYPCPLRITRGNDIILGSFDIDCVINETDDDSWEIQDNNMYDINVRDKILPILPQKVVEFIFSDSGDIDIILENEMKISLFVCSTSMEIWKWVENTRGESYVREVFKVQ